MILYIGNVLCIISDKKIKMNSLGNLDEIDQVSQPLLSKMTSMQSRAPWLAWCHSFLWSSGGKT